MMYTGIHNVTDVQVHDAGYASWITFTNPAGDSVTLFVPLPVATATAEAFKASMAAQNQQEAA